jgi:phosphoribosylanthranilate isomerase
MPADIAVKICGLRRPQEVAAAAQAGARYVGFVFFPKSPRHLEFADAADLASGVPVGLCKVALTVNADDAMLDALTAAVPLDMLQLHGSESPARVAQVKARYGLPVMKAVGVGEAADLSRIDTYADVADQLLIDAKPPEGGVLPGGNGLSFDWQLLAGRVWRCPWMLAGGLTQGNVVEAMARTGARQLDVSSGVESSPGFKDPALIHALVGAALNA